MTEKSVPHRCERCVAEGSYTGMLRFPGDPVPKCRVHDREMEPVKEKKRV